MYVQHDEVTYMQNQVTFNAIFMFFILYVRKKKLVHLHAKLKIINPYINISI